MRRCFHRKFVWIVAIVLCGAFGSLIAQDEKAREIVEHYCFDCHDDASAKGNFNMEKLLEKGNFDGTLMFENLLTGKMPPADKDQPGAEEKEIVLKWLENNRLLKMESLSVESAGTSLSVHSMSCLELIWIWRDGFRKSGARMILIPIERFS